MTWRDWSAIHRQLGVIEGVAIALDNRGSDFLLDAVQTIGDIVDREVEKNG